MSDNELEHLAFRNRIRAHADGRPTVDRDMVINALQEIDRKSAPTHTTHHVINNYGSMTGSPIQQGTSHSNVTVYFQTADVQSIIDKIRSAMADLPLSDESKNELELDIRTIEPQLSSPNPKRVVIAECLRSMRAVLEGIAGSIFATGIVYEIDKVMKLVGN
jgi:hypothetical protein